SGDPPGSAARLVIRYAIGASWPSAQRLRFEARVPSDAAAWLSRKRAQILSQNLAHVRLRQRIEEAHFLRNLVGSELATAMGDHFTLGECRPRPLRREEPNCRAGLRVRYSDTATFSAARAGGGDRLNFIGVNVESGDDDHVLFAIDDS